jgi:hypothetical protein
LNTLIIPIVTGTAPTEVDSIQPKFAATDYSADIIYLPPLSQDAAMQVVANAAKYFATQEFNTSDPNIKSRFIDTKNSFFADLIRFAAPLPQYAQFVGSVLAKPPQTPLLSIEHMKSVWLEVKGMIEQQYQKSHWNKLLQREGSNDPPKLVKQLIKLSYFKEIVTRDKLIEGVAVSSLERSALIFLSPLPDDQDKFIITMAPIILHHLDQSYHFNFFDEALFYQFSRLDEETFPKYILAIHAATYKLLSIELDKDGKTFKRVSRSYIYRDAAVGADSSLQELIDIYSGVDIREVSGTYKAKYHVNKENLTNAALIAEGMKDGIEIVNLNNSSQPHLVLNSRRSPSSDAITPHGDEQYKFSLYIASAQSIPDNVDIATKFITDKLFEKELKKSTQYRFALISPKQLDPSFDLTKLVHGSLVICGENLKKLMGVFFTEAAYRSPK